MLRHRSPTECETDTDTDTDSTTTDTDNITDDDDDFSLPNVAPPLQFYVDEQIPLLSVAIIRHQIPIFRLDCGGKPVSLIESGRYGNSLCLFHSRRLIAEGNCSARNTSISVFSTESWRKLHEMNHEKRVTCLTTLDSTTDDSFLVSGSYDHTVRIWDFSAAADTAVAGEGGIERIRYSPHRGSIGGICTVPSRKWICSRCIEYDYSYHIWDVQSQRAVHHQKDTIVTCIEYGNSFLITAELVGQAIRLTDINTFQSVKTLGVRSRIRAVGIDSDKGQYLYACESGGWITMFDVRKESTAVLRKKIHQHAPSDHCGEDIVNVGVNLFASCCLEDVTPEKIRVWEGGTMKEANLGPSTEDMKPEGRVTRLCCLNPFDHADISEQREESERISFLITRFLMDENWDSEVVVIVVAFGVILRVLKSFL